MEFILKARPTDFVVSECMAIAPSAPGPGDSPTHHYLRLRKAGYRTLDAANQLADYFNFARTDVGFAGLKDEDAVTEQYISVPRPLGASEIGTFNRTFVGGPAFLELEDCRSAGAKLGTGELDGNSFRVVVRGLSRELADDLAKLPGAPALHVLNYYDTQRFGVPKAPKTTHLIGSALLSGDTDNALRLLRLSGTPEADAAKGHRRSSAEFFRELDPRVRAFLCCAHASFEWNSRLRERLVSIAAGGCVSMSVEGVPFVFAQSDADAVRLMASQPTLPYDAYRAHDGEVRCTQAQRATVLPVRFRLHGIADDDLFAGMRKCEVSLFLPSGAYATNALRQLMLAGSVRRMATRSEAVEVGP